MQKQNNPMIRASCHHQHQQSRKGEEMNFPRPNPLQGNHANEELSFVPRSSNRRSQRWIVSVTTVLHDIGVRYNIIDRDGANDRLLWTRRHRVTCRRAYYLTYRYNDFVLRLFDFASLLSRVTISLIVFELDENLPFGI